MRIKRPRFSPDDLIITLNLTPPRVTLLFGRRPGVPTHITWIDVRVKISVLSDSANHYESSAPVYNSPTVHNHDNAGDQDNDILEDVNLKENVECDSSLELSDEFISNSCVSGISLGTRGAFSFWNFARNRGCA